jgi:hypothetical protein
VSVFGIVVETLTETQKSWRETIMKRILLTGLVCILMLALGATPAMASNYGCVGSVTFLGLDHVAGTVVVSLAGSMVSVNYVYICQVGASWNGWSQDACKALYSQLLVARSTGAQVQLWFTDNLNSCTQQPQWAPVAVYFVSQ